MAPGDGAARVVRACEADRCEHGATVNGRWCERHAPVVVVTTTALAEDPNGPSRAHSVTYSVGTPEYAQEAHTISEHEWTRICAAIAEAEGRLAQVRETRRALLEEMRAKGMSLADIAEVTGLTRQRIGQLLKP